MIWMILPALLIFFGGFFYVIPYAFRLLSEFRLRRRCRKDHVLVLTYDDGPGEETTPKLLDLLDQHHAKATFYLVGKNVESKGSILPRMQHAGHDLASHSQNHLNGWKVTPWRSLRDVLQGFSTLKRTNIDFSLFRPPYGKINLLTWLAAARHRIQLGWWTIVSGDTCANLPDVASIVAMAERDGGGVVLMHDFDRSEERFFYVLDLTARLLNLAKSRGWKVMTHRELLQNR
jgi:peptidoglycan/xylan/chitin deacetylase (PgdA/CDA1 family)